MHVPDTFTRQVGLALAHLYDPDVLRGHSLVEIYGIRDRSNPQAGLRSILIEGIEALKPKVDTPIDSRSWRVYRLLQLRFVQQLDQAQTAYQLGIGVRHLRREQKASVQVLADSLADKYQLDLDLGKSAGEEKGIKEEFFWLKSPVQEISTNPGEIFSGALEVAGALAVKLGVHLQADIQVDLPPITIDPAGLRQLTISLVTYAINRAPGGQVVLRTALQENFILLEVRGGTSGQIQPETGEDAARFSVACSILAENDIQVKINEGSNYIFLVAMLTEAKLVKVLMIDDNPDMCQLAERYAKGTRYHFTCTPNADNLFEIVKEIRPQAILLDVMVPGMDGWEILGRLRQNPLTGDLPVIICTVLPERDLALALGAAAFLPKPVTREVLLATLGMVLDDGRQGSG